MTRRSASVMAGLAGLSLDSDQIAVAGSGTAVPRLISSDDVEFIVETLAGNPVREVRIGRERLRQILHEHRITFQRTR